MWELLTGNCHLNLPKCGSNGRHQLNNHDYHCTYSRTGHVNTINEDNMKQQMNVSTTITAAYITMFAYKPKFGMLEEKEAHSSNLE